MSGTKEKLKKEVKSVKEKIENPKENYRILEILDYLEIIYHVEITGDIIGAEILLTSGGPNIRLIVGRNENRIKGVWGSERYTEPVKREDGDKILQEAEMLKTF
ncbi:MAG: hypothetical protein ACOCRK_05635 [bacterium]